MAASSAPEELFQSVPGLQLLRARVWLGLTQLGAGQYHDAQQSFAAARSAWEPAATGDDSAGDRLEAQLADWIARSRGN